MMKENEGSVLGMTNQMLDSLYSLTFELWNLAEEQQ